MTTEERKRRGIVNIESDFLLLGDPCYTLHGETAKKSLGVEDISDLGSRMADAPDNIITESAAMVFPVRPGVWMVEATEIDDGAWGQRIARLRITGEILTSGIRRREVGVAFVDAGLMMVSDPAKTMFNPDPAIFGTGWSNLGGTGHGRTFCDILEAYEKTTGQKCATFFPVGGGAAVVTGTGCGDGSYPVTVEIGTDGYVQAIEIDFYAEDEDEWLDALEDDDEEEL
ncbi:hypothetical protein KKA53_05095 [Candidatus Dependentiae bacterium]|nr:hypothetical protein [Candidatus Dependentiae bacterium]